MAKEPVRIIQKVSTKQTVTQKIQHDVHHIRKGIEIHTKKKLNDSPVVEKPGEKPKPLARDGMRLQEDAVKVNVDRTPKPNTLPATPTPIVSLPQVDTTWVNKDDQVVVVHSNTAFVILAHKDQLENASVECWAMRLGPFMRMYTQK